MSNPSYERAKQWFLFYSSISTVRRLRRVERQPVFGRGFYRDYIKQELDRARAAREALLDEDH